MLKHAETNHLHQRFSPEKNRLFTGHLCHLHLPPLRRDTFCSDHRRVESQGPSHARARTSVPCRSPEGEVSLEVALAATFQTKTIHTWCWAFFFAMCWLCWSKKKDVDVKKTLKYMRMNMMNMMNIHLNSHIWNMRMNMMNHSISYNSHVNLWSD